MELYVHDFILAMHVTSSTISNISSAPRYLKISKKIEPKNRVYVSV